jgi:DNA mismatch repair protein MutS
MKDEISIYEEYFEYVQKYTEMHGPKTVVCMQVGSFYEIYGLKYPNSDVITGSLISEISDITGLSVVSKKYTYLGATVYMSGFRDLYHTFDKYLQIMMEHGYIVVEIVQDNPSGTKDTDTTNKKKKKTHSFKAVHSSGTYLSYETDARPNLTNHMMSIWMEQNCKKKRLIYGVSVLNIYTGESAIFEHEMADWMNPTMFDELERYVAMYAPSEVIFLHNFLDSDSDSIEKAKKILQYIKIPSNTVVHLLSISEKSISEKGENTKNRQREILSNSSDRQREIILNCTKQKYIEYVLDKYFGEDTFQICSEFTYYMYATQSLCYLLHFLEEHNQCFTQRLSLPTFQNTSKRVVLANHTLKQLNILPEGKEDNKGIFGSILSLLNKCQTAMGKRKFQTQLLQPVFDEKWLNQEYEMTDFFRKGFEKSDRGFEKSDRGFEKSDRGSSGSGSDDGLLMENFRKGLAKVKDLEKIGRQIIAKKIYPSSIYDLHQSLSILQQLQVCLAEVPKNVLEYLSVDESDLSNLLNFLETNIRIQACQNQGSGGSSGGSLDNIIAKGISKEIDEYQNRFEFLHFSLLKIREYLGKYVILKKKEKDAEGTDSTEDGPIKISESDKNGFVLSTTKARGDAMVALLSNKEEHTISIMNNDIKPEIRFTKKEIRISNINKTTSEIHFPSLDAITEEMDYIRSNLQEKTKYYFLQFLDHFIEGKYDSLLRAIRFASTLDVILCKAYIAKKYHYCRPVIESSRESSFVDARDIRHALIEHINQKEIYVTNDLRLGLNEVKVEDENMNGMVLFGTNAVGKTSLIRALGIAVIMAQAGIYVPCSSFRYSPYTAIFSRILSNDNLFKGLSTFAVEISELGIILKNADQNSLILADELCSGTETDSALAIFMTTLEHLHKKQSTFLFATHFHEILEFEEMGDLIRQSRDRIGIYHLAVTYDREKDCLIYDRKLREGEGSRTYGLEVCKSLYLPTAFLERAYELRRKMSPENDGILSHVSSKYNTKKIRGFCENCHVQIGEEIHHLREQKEANRETGYFDKENGIHWIHKNHPANLMSVCAKCHDLLHAKGAYNTIGYNVNREEETESGNISPITTSTFYQKPESETKIKKTRIRKKTTNGYTLI